MENTLENKAKFFAQYYGCSVEHISHKEGYFIGKVDSTSLGWISNDDKLILKDLKNISDEDAIEVYYKFYNNVFKSDVTKSVKEMFQSYVELSQEEADYFRLKGYAVKYNDLEVSKQIEYGWVKLN